MSAAEAARFAEAVRRLVPEGGRIGLAVSGGPDSLAMLLLAQAAIPGDFEVATVDHGLRPEAAEETAFVEHVCATLGVACETLRITVDPGNVQASARKGRYRALDRWASGERNLTAIATAHHADDQAETLLMRLNRGSGVAGLAGVRARGPIGWGFRDAIRPLLAWRRAELEAIVERAGLRPVLDPSNLDDRYDRVRIRQALADAPWLDVMALSRSAAHLADAEGGLEHYTELLREHFSYVGPPERGIECAGLLPREAQFRMVRMLLGEVGWEPRGSEIARLVDGLRAGRGGNAGGVLVTIEGENWVFRPEPPRRG